MKTPVSRRAAMAAGLSVAAGLTGCSRRNADEGGGSGRGDDKSWVGKTVLPKKADPAATFSAPPIPPPQGLPPRLNAPPEVKQLPVEVDRVDRTLGGASWTVKTEKEATVQVLDTDGTACWVKKELLVLLADAVDFYTKAIKEDEKDAYAFNFRGWTKYLLGKPEEAVKDFDEFLKLVLSVPGPYPHNVIGFSNRGLVLAEAGKFDAALKDLDEAVKLGHLPAVLNRGWAHELKGDYEKAAADYATLIAADPTNPLGLNNAAWLRATCPDAKFRDGKEAITLAKRACERSANREGAHLDTLAAAHAEAGDFAAAVKTQELALEDVGYARKYGDDAQKRLQLYKDKKPYRSEPLR